MKTTEEKAQAYTDSTDTRVFGCEETLDASELIQKGYLAGAKEALAGQWRCVEDELPKADLNTELLIIRPDSTYRKFDVAVWDGEDWYTTSGRHIRPTHWMPIPEPPKKQSHV